MENSSRLDRYSDFLNIVVWGSIWGIFEATAGYLLHLLPFNFGWIVWYPAACFFMVSAYRKSGNASSVIYVALLCASIKLLNLLLPIRIDKVINPSVSIVLESISMYLAIKILGEGQKKTFVKAISAISMNTAWRLMFALYLLVAVPDWMRDISVISSTEKIISFFITQNIITSLVIFICYQFLNIILKPIKALEGKISKVYSLLPQNKIHVFKVGIVCMMFCLNIILELLL